MYNAETGEVLVTKAKIDGQTYQGYLVKGFKPISKINGLNIVVSKLTDEDKINLNKIT